jgi:gas vesicle protein
MKDKRGNIWLLVGGIAIGGLVGGGVALLSAPQSGMETRNILRNKGLELKDKVVSEASATRQFAEKAITDVRDRANEVIHRTQPSLEDSY